MIVVNDEYLKHYGIPGMRWGVRRANHNSSIDKEAKQKQKEEYQQKIKRLAKGEYVSNSDKKRFEYASKPLARRIAGQAAGVAVGIVIQDTIKSFGIPNYAKASKQELISRAIQITANTAKNVIVKDALAKSAAKKYGDNDKLIKGTPKDGVFLGSREDKIETAINVIVPRAVGLGLKVGSAKMSSVLENRYENKKRYDAWGGNILEEKLANVIWASPDGDQVIYKGMPPGVKAKKV